MYQDIFTAPAPYIQVRRQKSNHFAILRLPYRPSIQRGGICFVCFSLFRLYFRSAGETTSFITFPNNLITAYYLYFSRQEILENIQAMTPLDLLVAPVIGLEEFMPTVLNGQGF